MIAVASYGGFCFEGPQMHFSIMWCILIRRVKFELHEFALYKMLCLVATMSLASVCGWVYSEHSPWPMLSYMSACSHHRGHSHHCGHSHNTYN